MIGRRLPNCNWGEGPSYNELAPGDYVLVQRGEIRELHFRDPRGLIGRVSKHTITEEGDGTITVSPSILTTQGAHGGTWHGFLEHGVWRDA